MQLAHTPVLPHPPPTPRGGGVRTRSSVLLPRARFKLGTTFVPDCTGPQAVRSPATPPSLTPSCLRHALRPAVFETATRHPCRPQDALVEAMHHANTTHHTLHDPGLLAWCITLDFSWDDTVSRVKAALKEYFEIPVRRQRLLSYGQHADGQGVHPGFGEARNGKGGGRTGRRRERTASKQNVMCVYCEAAPSRARTKTAKRPAACRWPRRRLGRQQSPARLPGVDRTVEQLDLCRVA